jgi:NAD(P)H-hydrate epimerase
LAGQGFPAETAAAAGVYLHGLAGDIMAGEIGEAGLTAGDLPLGVARAIKKLQTDSAR